MSYGYGLKADAIVGYTYAAETYCPECVTLELVSDEHNSRADSFNDASRYYDTTEANLDRMAAAFGIDRQLERTYDSDEFPKVIFSVQVESDEFCGRCHESLIPA